MTNLEEFETFAREFMQLEYEAQLAKLTEPDDDVFISACQKLTPFFNTGMRINVKHSTKRDQDIFEQGKKVLDRGELRPRTLYQIKEYKHPQLGYMYRVYFSNSERLPNSERYRTCLFCKQLGEEFKIIAWYEKNIRIEPEDKMFVDNGLSWLWMDGVQFETLGQLVTIEKFMPPNYPEDLAEYEAE